MINTLNVYSSTTTSSEDLLKEIEHFQEKGSENKVWCYPCIESGSKRNNLPLTFNIFGCTINVLCFLAYELLTIRFKEHFFEKVENSWK